MWRRLLSHARPPENNYLTYFVWRLCCAMLLLVNITGDTICGAPCAHGATCSWAATSTTTSEAHEEVRVA
jgi:hypothetical protein